MSDASTRVLVAPVVAGPANAAINLHSCGCRAGATHQVIDRGSATFGMFSHAGWCQQRQPARPLDPTRPPPRDRWSRPAAPDQHGWTGSELRRGRALETAAAPAYAYVQLPLVSLASLVHTRYMFGPERG